MHEFARSSRGQYIRVSTPQLAGLAMTRTRILAALSLAFATQISHAAYTGFEDLTVGSAYGTGSTISSGGVNFGVVPFNLGSTISVSSTNYAGGSGKSLFLGSRIGLDFNLPTLAQGISLRYGQYCCDYGVRVNGVNKFVSSFLDLNGMTVGGVNFEVSSQGGSNSRGIMTVTGNISSFVIGGTEVGIDDVSIVLNTQPGDFDADGDVDGRDFLIWQRGMSSDPLSPSDLSDWQTNYGSANFAAATSVPEPTSLALVSFVLIAFALLIYPR
jgi:hypothetical protein